MNRIKVIGKELLERMSLHNVTVVAAGIAFYGLLATIPTLTALVATYGLVSDPADIESQIAEVSGSLSDSAAETLQELLNGIVNEVKASATPVLIGSILVALFSASGAVQKLLGAINMAYNYVDDRPGWKIRIGSYLFTAAAIVLIAVLAALISVVPQLLAQIEMGGVAELAITILRLPLVAVLFVLALTILYRYGPGRRPRTPWINPGSFVGGGLFILSAIGLSIYTSSAAELPASYSLLGGVAVIMIFLQLAALSVVLGAEVNGIIEPAPAEENRRTAATTTTVVKEPAEPVSFGKAMAGVAAIVLLGRGGND